MAYERITEDPQFDGKCRDSHEARYRIASGFTEAEDSILDAGCGIGYGSRFFDKLHQAYQGIDIDPPTRNKNIFLKVDFETNEGIEKIDADFDVFVGLEIIEHLNDEGVNNFINLAHKAKKWIIISTPIVKNSNPYHKQQFTEEMVLQEFKWEGWKHHETFYQGEERYGIFIFKRI